jgi:hypothetical protein
MKIARCVQDVDLPAWLLGSPVPVFLRQFSAAKVSQQILEKFKRLKP